jgi:hypothetical protein
MQFGNLAQLVTLDLPDRKLLQVSEYGPGANPVDCRLQRHCK